MPGALFQGEKLPECRPGLADVQPFVTTKTIGKSRGLTSLDFAQLGPVRPSGPPYLHSVYCKYRNYSTRVSPTLA